MEFVLIISLVLLVMLIALVLVNNLLFSSSTDVRNAQMREIGQTVTDQAREVNYLGLFTQEIVSFNMPDDIIKMGTVTYNGSSGPEHYMYATMRDSGRILNFTFPSEVPLVTEDCSTYNCISGVSCVVCNFKPLDYKPGRKNFKLESTLWAGGYAVNISRADI